MQKTAKPKRSFRVSPYLFVLVSAYLVLVTAAFYYALHDDIRALLALGGWREMVQADGFDVVAVMGVIYIVNLLVVWLVSEQYFGILRINDDCVVLRRPLRRAKKTEVRRSSIDRHRCGHDRCVLDLHQRPQHPRKISQQNQPSDPEALRHSICVLGHGVPLAVRVSAEWAQQKICRQRSDNAAVRRRKALMRRMVAGLLVPVACRRAAGVVAWRHQRKGA